MFKLKCADRNLAVAPFIAPCHEGLLDTPSQGMRSQLCQPFFSPSKTVETNVDLSNFHKLNQGYTFHQQRAQLSVVWEVIANDQRHLEVSFKVSQSKGWRLVFSLFFGYTLENQQNLHIKKDSGLWVWLKGSSKYSLGREGWGNIT